MSSLSTHSPSFRPHAVRTVTVGFFVCLLILLGFLVPFWIVLVVGFGLVCAGRGVSALRAASRKVDQILAEELPPNGRAG
ncbi:hypothetical protein [Kibdelosporangium phytohabitans]|uniref:Uncharacterized protein n=1 Tax=Kibdelosporangium phytohabitans TaxID=860235 RepID=A0A0N9HUT9_9PSEU|nr:hypothetical protein [Kibdelosporangium phytohabitans]ALG05768.1 hypothetical protein AOZ06_01475 [Kibdelosporangium phytohabitans]MBE1466232.1 hypothetical protein [Kibdelosporangium phytohabitans]